MWLPFFCLAAGALLGPRIRRWADFLLRYTLFLLLFGLGARIGLNRKLLASIPRLGAESLVVCLAASAMSILLVAGWDVLFRNHRTARREDCVTNGPRQDLRRELLFILAVVFFLGAGMASGYLLAPPESLVAPVIDLSLIVIYTSVGVGLKDGVAGLKSSPHKTAYLFIPLLITAGSIAGGYLAGLLLHSNAVTAGAIGGGMGYYSLSMAVVTQKAGVEMGFVAFLANFLREVMTFFLSPILARFSTLAPIALGGATTMDTTLVMMRRCLGEEKAVLSFFSGAVLTLIAPFLLLFVLSW